MLDCDDWAAARYPCRQVNLNRNAAACSGREGCPLPGWQDTGAAALRRKAARWTEDNSIAISTREPEIPEAIFNRQADNWEPLLAIAEAAGPEVAVQARAAALAACGAHEDDSLQVRLLADIRGILECEAKPALPSKALVGALLALPDQPWPECNHGKPVTQAWLARRLKAFGVEPSNVRTGGKVQKCYAAADFADAFARYLPGQADKSATSATALKLNGFLDPKSATEEGGVALFKRQNVLENNVVADVALSEAVTSGLAQNRVFRGSKVRVEL